jgi:general secretion pathway protein C
MFARAMPRLFSLPTLATFVGWALAGACVVFWGLKLSAPNTDAAMPAPLVSGAAAPDAQAIAAVMGARQATDTTNTIAETPTNTPASSRFSLQGVLQQRGGGVAVIVVEGKPPKHFRVGAVVDDGYVLQAVGLRSAQLGPSANAPAAFTLELPARTALVSSVVSPALASRPAAPGTPAVPATAYTGARGLQQGATPTVGFPPVVQMPPMNPAGASAANPETAGAVPGSEPARGAPAARGLARGAAAAAEAAGQTANQQDR